MRERVILSTGTDVTEAKKSVLPRSPPPCSLTEPAPISTVLACTAQPTSRLMATSPRTATSVRVSVRQNANATRPQRAQPAHRWVPRAAQSARRGGAARRPCSVRAAAAPAETSAATKLTEKDLVDYIRSGCKPKSAWRCVCVRVVEASVASPELGAEDVFAHPLGNGLVFFRPCFLLATWSRSRPHKANSGAGTLSGLRGSRPSVTSTHLIGVYASSRLREDAQTPARPASPCPTRASAPYPAPGSRRRRRGRGASSRWLRGVVGFQIRSFLSDSRLRTRASFDVSQDRHRAREVRVPAVESQAHRVRRAREEAPRSARVALQLGADNGEEGLFPLLRTSRLARPAPSSARTCEGRSSVALGDRR